MGFSRQKYWNGLPFPSLGDLPNQGIESRFPALQEDSLLSEPPGKPPYPLNWVLEDIKEFMLLDINDVGRILTKLVR